MIELRNVTQELIQCQMEDGSDEEIALLQKKLNQQYDRFSSRYVDQQYGKPQGIFAGQQLLSAGISGISG